MPLLGEALALSAAVLWSFAVILFKKTGETVPALALNLFKNALVILLLLATLIASGTGVLRDAPARQYAILLASGAIGIGLADTFFFLTLNRVGAGLQSIITTTYSPFIILAGVLFLGERLTPMQVVGVALILLAVLGVMSMRSREPESARRRLVAGIVYGLLATSTQAVAVAMMKRTLEEVPLLWANLWRLVGGMAMTLVLIPLLPNRRAAWASLLDFRAWKVMVPASILGTYLSLLCWLGGMKYTQISTASVLNQTATLWTFLLAAVLLREPAGARRIAALLLGDAGVALVTLGASR